MQHALARCAVTVLVLASAAGSLAGCGHGGIVRTVTYSGDGHTVMYKSENAGEGTYVADRDGPVRVGRDGSAYLSPDGRYVFLVDTRANQPRWPGDRLVLYDVAHRSRRSKAAVPAKLYNPDKLARADGWEPDLAEVRFDAGPAVVLGVTMVNFREDPPRRAPIRYIRWRPGKSYEPIDAPRGTPPSTAQVDTDDADSWVVVRQPDSDNPFRTVWVHPDGNVIELLRSTQGFGATAFRVSIFPFVFWAPSYYRMNGWLEESNRADPDAAAREGPRIERLIANRQADLAARAGPIPADGPPGP